RTGRSVALGWALSGRRAGRSLPARPFIPVQRLVRPRACAKLARQAGEALGSPRPNRRTPSPRPVRASRGWCPPRTGEYTFPEPHVRSRTRVGDLALGT